jgi:hypothetical protein
MYSKYSKTREDVAAKLAADVQQQVEFSRTVHPIRTLFALAQADALGLDYRVKGCENKSSVTVVIKGHSGRDLDYNDDATVVLHALPDNRSYTEARHVDNLFEFNNRVMVFRAEQKRLAEVKRDALAKLSDEEKQVLGLK